MALGGTRQDAFLTLFKDQLEHEMQQEGSRLGTLFTKEMMQGQKAFFHKFGALGAPRARSSYNEPVVFGEKTFERRLLTFEPVWEALPLDGLELNELVMNPMNDMLKAISAAMGRDMDRVIMAAIKGSATVQLAGSTSTVALPPTQKIAVSDITYDLDLAAGDKGLTPGKLMKAKTIMEQRYVTGDLVVIAPAGQIGNVLAHARASSGDYVAARPLESSGFQQALSGYLGLNFISYEETGVDSSSDELVYVVSRNALKLGQRQQLQIRVENRTDLVNVEQIKGIMDLGAVRMFEEAVVEIACDPRKVS